MKLIFQIAGVVLLTVACVEAPALLSEDAYWEKLLEIEEPDSSNSDIDAGDVPKDFGRPNDNGDDPDDGPCVPSEQPGDWCDGIDNNCNGVVDEDAKPLAFIEKFDEPHGWLRKTPTGNQNHSLGPIVFADYTQANHLAWLPMTLWSGDIELDIRLLVGSVAPGAEFFIGSYLSMSESGQFSGRTGVRLKRYSDSTITASLVINDEELSSLQVKSNEFQRILFTVAHVDAESRARFLRGDGSLVDQIKAPLPTVVPSYAGLLVSAEKGTVVGSVSRLGVAGGFYCEATDTALCTAVDCQAAELCEFNLCNPWVGCHVVANHCAPAVNCFEQGVCNVETGDCSQAQKADGEACTLGCVTAAVCNAGVCEGTEPVVCDEPSQCLEAATCVPAFNQCVFPTKLDGLECDDGSLCTQGDQCIHGECLAGVDTTCPTNETCESVSICEPSTGECSEVLPLEDETSCDDSDPCTDVDTCIGGECISQVVKDCDDGNPCTTDSCGPTGCMYVGGTVEECVLWEVNTTGFISGPPGVHGPNLYVAAAKLAAINSDSGELLWESEEVVDCTSPSPSVSPDGSSLYIGDVDKEGKARLAHVNANTGQLEWGYSVGVGDNCAPGPQDPCRIPSVPTRTDTAIYIATRGSGVYAVSHAGKSVWHLGDADEINRSSVVASQSGNLYIGLYGGQSKGVMSMNGDGTVRWKAPTETGVVETPVVAADKIYVTAGSSVYAFADAGETANQLWTVDLGATVATTQPILDGKGSLIVASKDTLWALKTEECDNTVANCVLWTVQSPQGKISRGLSLIDDGLVSFGTQAGLQFVNTVDGTWAWGVNLPTLQVSSPAILSTGRLVVGAKDGFVRAISYKPGVSPGQSLWPVLNRDQKRNAIAF